MRLGAPMQGVLITGGAGFVGQNLGKNYGFRIVI
jgi:nucleoside-diphosphate-sugar epimerase